MNNKEKDARIALLETQVDYFESELTYLNRLLINCGFTEGVQTLKRTVEDLLDSPVAESPEEGSEFV